ncbi:MAG TPA: flavin reductase family protein [Armatimonadetes bacterium]|nr:flavin reductase family protein [Armatimonadota bacterium]
MAKRDVHYTEYFAETMQVLTSDGLLLVSVDRDGKPNAMTIGWATIGSIWGKPLFLVLVRPSRYTYGLIEATGDFTVNVPPKELAEVCAYCGTVSGRDYDKFAEKGLTATPSRRVNSPIIAECVIHYECRVVHKNDIVPAALVPEITASSYPAGDFHRVYFGEILAVYADEDARERISGPQAR